MKKSVDRAKDPAVCHIRPYSFPPDSCLTNLKQGCLESHGGYILKIFKRMDMFFEKCVVALLCGLALVFYFVALLCGITLWPCFVVLLCGLAFSHTLWPWLIPHAYD